MAINSKIYHGQKVFCLYCGSFKGYNYICGMCGSHNEKEGEINE